MNIKIQAEIIRAKLCSLLKGLVFLGFAVSPYFSFATDTNHQNKVNQEVRVMINNSQAIEAEGSSDTKAIIESSASVGNQYQSEVNEMINVSKEAIKEHQCQDSFDTIGENDSKAEHTGSDDYYRYVFISTSMPKQALKEIFAKATKENALIVLRGFKNNSYLDTQKHFSELIWDTNTGFVVDPELFKIYKINVVPSFVMSQGMECEGQSNSQNQKCITPGHDSISGNISIDYAFETLSKDGDLAEEVKLKEGVQQ